MAEAIDTDCRYIAIYLRLMPPVTLLMEAEQDTDCVIDG